LADENRIRVVMALRGGELCACQITELFGLAPSTMSKHLSNNVLVHLVGAYNSMKIYLAWFSRLANCKRRLWRRLLK
jgi:DNA-binding transcriptional ArsR family regulator